MPTFGSELLLNPGFETAGAGGADVFANWIESAGNGTIAATSTAGEFRTGQAVKLTAGASRNTFEQQNISGITAGLTYRLNFWTRGNGSVSGRFGVYDSSNSVFIRATASSGVTSSTFTEVTYDFAAPTGCTALRIYFYCPDTNAAFACFDDASLRTVSTFDATNLSAPETYTEDTPLNLTDIVASGATTLTATLTLSVPSAGSLNTGTSSAVTSTYNAGTGVWSVSGAQADVNVLLAGLIFTPALNYNSNFTIATSLSDGSSSLTGTKAITGTAVNDGPSATNLIASEIYNLNTTRGLVDIVISDGDSASVTATLTLSDPSAGSLNTGTSGAVTSTYNAGTGVWSASGLVANVNVLLALLAYTPATGYTGNFTITTSVSDGVAAAVTGTKSVTYSADPLLSVVNATVPARAPLTNSKVVATCRSVGITTDPVAWQLLSDTLVTPSLTPPSWFTWSLPFTITDRTWATTLDITTYAPSGTQYYVDFATGSDSSDGLSTGTPKKTLRAVLDLSVPCTIWVKPHVWDYTNGWNGRNFNDNLSLRRWGSSGDVVLSNHQPGLSFALESAPNNLVYKSACAVTIAGVRDAASLDSDGLYTRLTSRASIALVQSSGGYYVDGSNLYVRLAGDVSPTDIRAYVSAQNGWAASDTTTYLENITFEGGSHGMRSSNNLASGKLYAKGCTFRYATSSSGNGVTFEGGTEAFFVDCVAEGNYLDGFKVFAQNGLVPNVALIRCTGRYNGWGNPDIGNGHSRHDGGHTVSVQCTWHDNYGANYHDITGSLSWLVGCDAYNSRATTALRVIDYACGVDGDGSKLHLHRCTSSGSTYAIESRTGCVVEVRDMSYSTTVGSGTITQITAPFGMHSSTGAISITNADLLAIDQQWLVDVRATDAVESTDDGTIYLLLWPFRTWQQVPQFVGSGV